VEGLLLLILNTLLGLLTAVIVLKGVVVAIEQRQAVRKKLEKKRNKSRLKTN